MYCSFKIHRRGRALRKLAKQLNEGTLVMTSRSLQEYIMPYAMTALFDEKMLKVTYLHTDVHQLTSIISQYTFAFGV